MTVTTTDNQALKSLLASKDPSFWQRLSEITRKAKTFEELHLLSTLRRRALAQSLPQPQAFKRQALRLAIVGGYSFYPLSELVHQLLFAHGFDLELFTGEYDNHVWEIMDESSALYAFAPEIVVLMPPVKRYRYSGNLTDSTAEVEAEVKRHCADLMQLCERVHSQCGAEVILCNFVLPCHFDPGMLRTRMAASEWTSLKLLNLQLGLQAPPYVHICDLEFLSARLGGLNAYDHRAWCESKQPFSADFAYAAAGEIAHIASSLRLPSKKVLVMDLDDTIWGGVIGDDGLNGIELGDTSPRGQAYKEFQREILQLFNRGVLLAVCSKNEFDNAIEPFDKHPEMLLHREHIACFKANWNPKSENLIEIANELGLGLDSLVFIDDNPAEIELVQQFTPDVSTIWLGRDPAEYIAKLKDCRHFEPQQLTAEDTARPEQYRQDQQRKQLEATAVDMQAYLSSLQMEALIEDFNATNAPRIAQLINKSNQFNLTTRRRTEAEVTELIGTNGICFTVRLKDRFGDTGLISVVIAIPLNNEDLEIDTWIMSCRVLKRQVEHVAMNELFARANQNGYRKVKGVYIPTAKNQMVKDFYPGMGFNPSGTAGDAQLYEAVVTQYRPFTTQIKLIRS
jgi:FkbH-like protein